MSEMIRNGNERSIYTINSCADKVWKAGEKRSATNGNDCVKCKIFILEVFKNLYTFNLYKAPSKMNIVFCLPFFFVGKGFVINSREGRHTGTEYRQIHICIMYMILD